MAVYRGAHMYPAVQWIREKNSRGALEADRRDARLVTCARQLPKCGVWPMRLILACLAQCGRLLTEACERRLDDRDDIAQMVKERWL
jgi:hypothetical protein